MASVSASERADSLEMNRRRAVKPVSRYTNGCQPRDAETMGDLVPRCVIADPCGESGKLGAKPAGGRIHEAGEGVEDWLPASTTAA